MYDIMMIVNYERLVFILIFLKKLKIKIIYWWLVNIFINFLFNYYCSFWLNIFYEWKSFEKIVIKMLLI